MLSPKVDMAIFIFTVDMLHVFSFDEKSRVRMHYAARRQSIKIPFFVCRSRRFLHTDILRGAQFKEHFPYLIVTAALIFISLVEYK